MTSLLTTTIQEPAAQVLAVFDGAAFDGEHAGQSWTCDPEVPDATPLRVVFTAQPVKKEIVEKMPASAERFAMESAAEAEEVIVAAAMTAVSSRDGTPARSPAASRWDCHCMAC